MTSTEDDKKWACDYCTYLNWPSASKCTLCRAPKPLCLIENFTFSVPDIYQLGEYGRTENSTDSVNESTSKTVKESKGPSLVTTDVGIKKWCCCVCTYLNWPKSVKCVQCLSSRVGRSCVAQPSSADTSIQSEAIINACAISSRASESTEPELECSEDKSSKKVSDDTRQVHVGACIASTSKFETSSAKQQNSGGKTGAINEEFISDTESAAIVNNETYSRSLSTFTLQNCISPEIYDPHNKTIDFYNEAVNEADINQPSSSCSSLIDSKLIARKLQKWTCPACTYENWPKCSRCIMCYTPKAGYGSQSQQRSSSRASPVSDSETFDISCGSNEKKRNHSSVSGGQSSISMMGANKSPRSASTSTESINVDSACAVASTGFISEEEREQRLRRLRKRLRDIDWLWLNACNTIASGSDIDAVEAYLASGGDPTRALTQGEVNLLNRFAVFEIGHTLLHLAVIHKREDLLTLLLTCTDQTLALGGRRIKKVPSHVSPDLASDIRRQIALSLRQRKGDLPCFFFTDLTTFSLPSGICDLSHSMQEKLFDELLDRDVQKELEEESPIINWSLELSDRLSSRLYALWNRTAGDCLLDSVLQATWGVFDSENSLRQALADSLNDAANTFYPRWKEYESIAAKALHFSLDENQWARDWDLVLQLASKPGSALEQAHVFALAHIIRRPIIVYGVRVVKSFRGETIGFARFEGVYLPLLWEPSFCWRSPICLGYTRGHFSALVPMEPDLSELGAAARIREMGQSRYVYLPLTDADGRLLPIHFLSVNESGHEQSILRTWLDCTVTEGGLLACRMKLHRLPPLVQQMIDDWLEYYHRFGQVTQAATAMIQSRQQQTARYNSSSPSHTVSQPAVSYANSPYIIPNSMSPNLSIGVGNNSNLPSTTCATTSGQIQSGSNNISGGGGAQRRGSFNLMSAKKRSIDGRIPVQTSTVIRKNSKNQIQPPRRQMSTPSPSVSPPAVGATTSSTVPNINFVASSLVSLDAVKTDNRSLATNSDQQQEKGNCDT